MIFEEEKNEIKLSSFGYKVRNKRAWKKLFCGRKMNKKLKEKTVNQGIFGLLVCGTRALLEKAMLLVYRSTYFQVSIITSETFKERWERCGDGISQQKFICRKTINSDKLDIGPKYFLSLLILSDGSISTSFNHFFVLVVDDFGDVGGDFFLEKLLFFSETGEQNSLLQ